MPVLLTAPCPVCQRPTPQAEVRSVQRGRLFLRCEVCWTVSNIPKPPKEDRL